jgi:deoxycytidylate deaminase
MLPALEAPEIVFGLCSPIGTSNAKITDLLKKHLLYYGYQAEGFKVTDLMRSLVISQQPPLKEKPVEDRYDTYIKYANKLREVYRSDDVLAMLCCAAVSAERKEILKKRKKKKTSYLSNYAYIFDQFKRKEEIDTLRQVYGRLFIMISAYSEKSERVKTLTNKICEGHSIARPTQEQENEAKKLIARDEDEEGQDHGQRIREIFPLADLFVNVDDPEETERVIVRFLRSFFGANNVSPTRDEYGMYIAKSASLRSLDLSRQVGAAIFSGRGEVISLGSNEVPKPHGGTYWAGDLEDDRDYVRGRDENERIKRALLTDVAKRLREGGFIGQDRSERDIVVYIMEEATKKGSLLRDALVMDLLEFGRSIHAEMSALSDAARLGLATRDATLYCTTFPCHICAKHIVAAGIKRLVFIEPYPKSYAEQLLSSIVVVAGKYSGDKIQFSPFIGVAPFRFRELFERGRRKNGVGNFEEWAEGRPRPVVKYTVATYLENEKAIIKILEEATTRLVTDGVLMAPAAKSQR